MRTKIFGAALAAAAAFACAQLAQAADNYPIKDGAGATRTFCSKDVAGVNYPCHVKFGMDGATPRAVTVDADGNQQVDVLSSALPAGAATEAAQTTGNGSLATIATNTTGVATGAKQDTGNASLATIATNTTGAATATNQATGNASLATIASNTSGLATAANQATGNGSLSSLVTAAGSTNTKLDTIASNTAGVATAANQATELASLASIDAKLSNLTPGAAGTVTITVQRATGTTAYSINDAWSDSTTAPTAGGFTLANVCRVAGGSGMITSATIVSSNDPASTMLLGELWLFDTAPTAINDNAVFTLSDADAVKVVPGGVIPFTLSSTMNGAGNNSSFSANGLNVGFSCAGGSTSLRVLIKVKNAYVPADSEQLTIRINFIATN